MCCVFQLRLAEEEERAELREENDRHLANMRSELEDELEEQQEEITNTHKHTLETLKKSIVEKQDQVRHACSSLLTKKEFYIILQKKWYTICIDSKFDVPIRIKRKVVIMIIIDSILVL